jgi:uncharacterized protein YdhG (YjbR/CyaY superfamily)
MNTLKKKITSVDEYIGTFPKNVGMRLEKIRSTIKKAAPGVQEKISWQMPGYFQNGILMFFAGHAHHIGVYALPGAIKVFAKELKGYKTSKGTIQFPHDKPLPLGLLGKIAKYRVKENELKVKAKQAKKAKKKS